MACPNCGDSRARTLPKAGDRQDYECPRCGPISVSGTDREKIEAGERTKLVKDENGRTWLKPVSNLPQG